MSFIIYHDDFDIVVPSSVQDTCHTWTQLNGRCPWVLVAQWIERPPAVRKVMGSISVRDSDFFFVPHWCYVDYFIFITFITELKIHYHLFHWS